MTPDSTDTPLVSVVIPTYDRPETLPPAVGSALDQSYPNTEIVVVDDHSSVPADEVLADHGHHGVDRVNCLRHETNRGGAAARNTGIREADGEFVAFLDDDDTWLETKLERQVETFRSTGPEVGLVYTGVRQVNARGRTNAVRTRDVGGDVLEQLLCRNVVGTLSTVMVRGGVIDRVGPFDERFPSWQDWEWYIRVAREYRVRGIAEPLVVRGNGAGDQISADYRTKRAESYGRMLEKYAPVARAEFGPGFERKRRAFVTFELARAAVQCHEYGEARRQVLRSIRRYPYAVSFYYLLGLTLFGRYSFEPARQLKRWTVRTLTD